MQSNIANSHPVTYQST